VTAVTCRGRGSGSANFFTLEARIGRCHSSASALCLHSPHLVSLPYRSHVFEQEGAMSGERRLSREGNHKLSFRPSDLNLGVHSCF
jgi:hypothetical protein